MRLMSELLPIERELLGWYSIVYSPDDGGWYADMAWDNTIDCPIVASPHQARAWALRHGGVRELKRRQ